MLRIKQTNSLDFSTAWSTSPHHLPILPLNPFFMKFRGPQAPNNRPQETMVCPHAVGVFPKTAKSLLDRFDRRGLFCPFMEAE